MYFGSAAVLNEVVSDARGPIAVCNGKRLKIVSCYVFIGFYANINIDILHFFYYDVLCKESLISKRWAAPLGNSYLDCYEWAFDSEITITICIFELWYALLRVSLRGIAWMQASHQFLPLVLTNLQEYLMRAGRKKLTYSKKSSDFDTKLDQLKME